MIPKQRQFGGVWRGKRLVRGQSAVKFWPWQETKGREGEEKKKKSFSGKNESPLCQACLRQDSGGSMTKVPQSRWPTLNRLRSRREGTALSAANEHKLDSDDDSEMIFTRCSKRRWWGGGGEGEGGRGRRSGRRRLRARPAGGCERREGRRSLCPVGWKQHLAKLSRAKLKYDCVCKERSSLDGRIENTHELGQGARNCQLSGQLGESKGGNLLELQSSNGNQPLWT